ncbi:MAG: hypothetical protein EOM02_00295 [Synergistales bacterium]|nr:hypothetical protein [Synergistales bacterium]
MGVIYVPPDNSGFDRLFQFSMAVRRAREAKEELLARQNHEKSLQDRQWSREDSLLEAERSRSANLTQQIFGGEAPSYDKSPIPEAPMTSDAFGGFAGLMERQYTPGLPKDYADLYRRGVNAEATHQELKNALDLFTQTTGTQRVWDAQDRLVSEGVSNPALAQALVGTINPGGLSTRYADPNELASERERARIAAAPQHGLNAQRAREWNEGGRQQTLAQGAHYKALADYKNAELKDLNNRTPLPDLSEVLADKGGKITLAEFEQTPQGQNFKNGLNENGVYAAMVRDVIQSNPDMPRDEILGLLVNSLLSLFGGELVKPDYSASAPSPSVPGIADGITFEDLQRAKEEEEAKKINPTGGGGFF